MAALVISVVALLLCGLVALAVMELLADRPAGADQPAEDSIEAFELSPGVEGTVASLHGLPEQIDRTSAHLALVISPVCATCKKLAASFEGVIPGHLTVIVTASDAVKMRKWATVHGLPLDEAVFDDDMSIVNGLGVASSPAAVGFLDGRVAFAAHLGGRRALDDLLAQRIAVLEQVADRDAASGSDPAPPNENTEGGGHLSRDA